MNKSPKTHKEGRDARDGRFTTVQETIEHPGTHVVERVPSRVGKSANSGGPRTTTTNSTGPKKK